MRIEDEHGSKMYPKRGIEIVKGQGATLWDSDGKEYVDMGASIGVVNVGHGNEYVSEAIREQSLRLVYIYSVFYNDQREKLLQKLAEISPGQLQRSFLCNSGTEAVEAAIKFARAYTKRKEIIAAKRGFHGKTFASLSATWGKKYREPFEPLVPGFKHVTFGDIDSLVRTIDKNTAAVLLEPIQGEAGVRIPPDDYLGQVRDVCDEHGALLILDEVQTGFGRTGKMWACQHHSVEPDIMCVAKSLAGGIPMGAMIARDEICALPPASHTSTFGGNPFACAAALASIRFIEENGLCERTATMGDHILNELCRIESKRIREVRGKGLMIGVELKEKVKPIITGLAEKGVLAISSGRTVLRFLPPLVIEKEQIDFAVSRFRELIGNG
ncbi:MAG: aspartate aminotransferase family protein [Thermoplasmata archaeon]